MTTSSSSKKSRFPEYDLNRPVPKIDTKPKALQSKNEDREVTNAVGEAFRFNEVGMSAAEAIEVFKNYQLTLGSEDGRAISGSVFGVGEPEALMKKLESVGYQCLHWLAVQICLILNAPAERTRALLLEGPSGCGKSFMAKSLAKVTGAEFMTLSCYRGMPMQNLIEVPSSLAVVSSMAGKDIKADEMMRLGIISRAFLKSQEKRVILLIDELDKPESEIDTFFLGPIQDGRIWLEWRDPIIANVDNLLLIFTKNFNRDLDEAFVRRVHPVKMTYLDNELERKVLSPYCHPRLIANLVAVADIMRNSDGSYRFSRPPAPEELLTAGHYIIKLIQWGMVDFAFVGKALWNILAKSDHDRAILEHMMRFHPEFVDPLVLDSRYVPMEEMYRKFGRILLAGIVEDPEAKKRREALREQLESDYR